MEPPLLRERREKHEALRTKMRQRLCKNSSLKLREGPHDYAKLEFRFEIVNSGCENDRRHASAYCQACSDRNAIKQQKHI